MMSVRIVKMVVKIYYHSLYRRGGADIIVIAGWSRLRIVLPCNMSNAITILDSIYTSGQWALY